MVLTVVSSYVPEYENAIFIIYSQDLTGQIMVSPDKFIVSDSSLSYPLYYLNVSVIKSSKWGVGYLFLIFLPFMKEKDGLDN